jgi:hypothetical protein
MTKVRSMEKDFYFDYIEYGKVFLEHEASDFKILEYSSEEIQDIAGRQRCQNFTDAGLRFPEPASRSPFASSVGNISLCFISPSKGYSLFIQIQRREEGELARSLKKTARLNRPFNQIRFTYLDLQEIEKELVNAVKMGIGIYSCMIFRNPSPDLLKKEISLKDYKSVVGNTRSRYHAHATTVSFGDEGRLRRIINTLGGYFSKEGFNNWKVKLKDLPLSTEEKINLLDAMQVLLWPVCGLFSFSLDFVSEHPDINFHLYETSNKNVFDLNNYQQESNDFFSDLMSFRSLYLDIWGDENFISWFRKYLFEIKSIENLIDAAEISNIVLGNKPKRELFVLESPRLFDAICKFGHLDLFIGHANAASLLRFIIKYKDSPQLSCLSMETAIIRIVNDISTLSYDEFMKFVENFWETVDQSFNLRELFLRAIKYKQIYSINDLPLRDLLFVEKTETDSNIDEDWLRIYASFSSSVRDKCRKELVQLFERIAGAFYKLRNSEKEVVYLDLYNYYSEESDIWKSPLLGGDILDRDEHLNEIIIKKFEVSDISIFGYLEYILKIGDVKQFSWLLDNISFNELDYKKIYDRIVDFSVRPNIAYNKMYDRICGKLSGIDLQKEMEFMYNMFPISERVESWAFQKLAGLQPADINKYLTRLKEHPAEKDGLIRNPGLQVVLGRIDFNALFKRCDVGDIAPSFLYAILERLDRFESDSALKFLVGKIPGSKLASNTLEYIAKNNIYITVPQDVAFDWLKKTRLKLRSAYYDGDVDLLCNYLSNLENCTDELLWEIYVVDKIERQKEIFSWTTYVASLPPASARKTLYNEYLSLVKGLSPVIDNKQSNLRRLKICRDIAFYYYGRKGNEFLLQLKGYENHVVDDAGLKEPLGKILEKEFPKKVVISQPEIKEQPIVGNLDSQSKSLQVKQNYPYYLPANTSYPSYTTLENDSPKDDNGGLRDYPMFNWEDYLQILALFFLVPLAIFAFTQWSMNPSHRTMLAFFIILGFVSILMSISIVWKFFTWMIRYFFK